MFLVYFHLILFITPILVVSQSLTDDLLDDPSIDDMKNVLIGLIAEIQKLDNVISTTDFTIATCPDNFEYVYEFNKCYKLIYKQVDWETSRNSCNSLHPKSHLVVIQNEHDQKALTSYLSTKTNALNQNCDSPSKIGNLWTSGQRVVPLPNSTFFWKPYANKWTQLTYTNWMQGRPGTDGKSCVHLLKNTYQWNDIYCEAKNSGSPDGEECSFCEIDLY